MKEGSDGDMYVDKHVAGVHSQAVDVAPVFFAWTRDNYPDNYTDKSNNSNNHSHSHSLDSLEEENNAPGIDIDHSDATETTTAVSPRTSGSGTLGVCVTIYCMGVCILVQSDRGLCLDSCFSLCVVYCVALC